MESNKSELANSQPMPNQAEIELDSEISDEELDNIGGGIVNPKNLVSSSSIIDAHQSNKSIIAILIG